MGANPRLIFANDAESVSLSGEATDINPTVRRDAVMSRHEGKQFPAIIRATTIMKAPRMTKTHGSLRAQKLVELGWTVKHEFKAGNETYEWYLEWEHVEEPPLLSSQDNWDDLANTAPGD